MRELLLIRHATAAWGGPTDYDRSLAPEGLEEAARVGARLAQLDPAPQLLVSSPARRAEQTAHAIHQALGLPEDAWRREPAIYEASLGALRQLLHGMDDAVERMVWVGHNPGFHELARALSDEAPRGLPPAGTVHLCFDAASWMSVDDRPARRTRFHAP